jgi:hypothetical protein
MVAQPAGVNARWDEGVAEGVHAKGVTMGAIAAVSP